eukprot:Selendium_serpulae@DN3482_c0_g1_i1.p1
MSTETSKPEVVAPREGETRSTATETRPMDIATLRRFLAPLSKEQLVELLASAALEHPAVYEKAQGAACESPSSRRLMIRNIAFGTTDKDFVALFKEYGEIEDATIVREKDKRSRGYGFVTYRNVDSVRKVLEATLTLDGRSLLSKLAADPFSDFTLGNQNGQGARRKLFVRNLSDTVTSDTLRGVFSTYGNLDECAVVCDADGRSRGFGFVTFVTPEAAIEAVQQPQRIINGRVAFVAFATRSKPKISQFGGSRRGSRMKEVQQMAHIPQINPAQYGYHPQFQAAHPMYPQQVFPHQIYAGLPMGGHVHHPDVESMSRMQQGWDAAQRMQPRQGMR